MSYLYRHTAKNPKNGTDNGGNGTYNARIAMAVGEKNVGVETFAEMAYEKACIPFSNKQRLQFAILEKKSKAEKLRKSKKCVKAARRFNQWTASTSSSTAEKRDGYEQYATGSGLGLHMNAEEREEDGGGGGDSSHGRAIGRAVDDERPSEQATRVRRCGNCRQEGHTAAKCQAEGVPRRAPPPEYTEVVKAGDVIAVWDLETTSKNPKEADPVELSLRFLHVDNLPDGSISLNLMTNKYDTLVYPLEGKIPAEATAVHGITMADVKATDEHPRAPSVIDMAKLFCDKIEEAAAAAQQVAGARRIHLLGHNSNVYDMKVMQCSLERAAGSACATWCERLKEAGVVGLIDSLVLLGGVFKAIDLPKGEKKKLDTIYPFLFDGEALPNAHRAHGDVEGLVRILQTCESMKACLLTKKVVHPLGLWTSRQELMAMRGAWEKRQKL
jgi:hypothetical protein